MDQDSIEKRHKFAVELFAPAIEKSKEIEELFTADYSAPRERADGSNAGDIKVIQPARPQALIGKFQTLLGVRSTQKKAVIPKDTSPEEEQACSTIEQWLHGYQRQYLWEIKRDPWRDMIFWNLLRGRGCLEARFDPSFIKSGKLPFRTTAADPNCVFPVMGENGIGYYTKEYTRYAWDLREEEKRRKQGEKKDRWQKLDLKDEQGDPLEDNIEISVLEYWDEEYCGAIVNGKLAYLKEHDYGFVPLAEARCKDTPLASMEWAYQGVLAPVANSLKNEFALAAKMAEGANLMYWPKAVVTMLDARVYVYDLGKINFDEIPLGVAKVDIVNVNPNAQVLGQSLSWFRGDSQLGTIPDIAWGAEPASLESGFAIQQVLGQVLDKIWDMKISLEQAFGWHDGHILRLVEKFGAGTGVSTTVPVERDYAY